MKRLLLLALFIPALLWGQDKSKYLADAVPLENGKVVFTEDIKTGALSKDQIYDIMLNWCKQNFTDDNNRVVYTDLENGDIATVGKTTLVFQQAALSVDRADMTYRLTIKCENNECIMKIAGIRYNYNVSYQREPEKYTAEDWITDEMALNKKKTKLYRNNGKFRIHTIDFADKLFESAANALGKSTMQATLQTQPVNQSEPRIQPTVQATAKNDKDGYIGFTASNFPSTFAKLLPDSKLVVVSKKKKDNSGEWKGLGTMFGKSIATISLDKNSEVIKEIGDNGKYQLTFFSDDNKDEPFIIIECQKQGETADGDNTSIIGEVLNILAK